MTGARLEVTGVYSRRPHNFAPRALTYNPNYGDSFGGLFNESRLVLRGGFGIAYNRVPLVQFGNARGNPPFFARYAICCSTSASDFSTPFNNGQILYALGATSSPFSYPTNPALPRTFNANGIPFCPPARRSKFTAHTRKCRRLRLPYSLEGQYKLPAKLTAEVAIRERQPQAHRLVNQRFLFPGGDVFSKRALPDAGHHGRLQRAHRAPVAAALAGVTFEPTLTASQKHDVVPRRPTALTNPTYPLDVREERGPSATTCATTSSPRIWRCPSSTAQGRRGQPPRRLERERHHDRASGFPWTPSSDSASARAGIRLSDAPVAYSGGAGDDSSDEAFITGELPRRRQRAS